jgi:hypothetical protein
VLLRVSARSTLMRSTSPQGGSTKASRNRTNSISVRSAWTNSIAVADYVVELSCGLMPGRDATATSVFAI